MRKFGLSRRGAKLALGIIGSGAWVNLGLWLMENTSPVLGVGPIAAGLFVLMYLVADDLVPGASPTTTGLITDRGAGLLGMGAAGVLEHLDRHTDLMTGRRKPAPSERRLSMQAEKPFRMLRHSRKHPLITFGLCVLMAFVTQVSAQQNLSFGERQSTEQLMADQLVAMAWRAFGQEQEARPDQLARAKILLDMASKLNPDDEGVWELKASLARSMQDQPMLIESLRHILRIRPRDDSAQLELIKAKLSSVEALDDYLGSLEKLLRAEGSSRLSAALRSRLGTLAAQAAQEIGDSDRASAWLSYALKLDPVNPEAARMIYQLTLDRGGSPRQQGAALVGLLKASPVDLSVRVALAELLMEQGVYSQAAEQYKVAIDLSDFSTRFSLLPPYVMCLIASGQEDKVPPLLLEVQYTIKQMSDAQNPDQDKAVDSSAEPQVQALPPLPNTLEFTRLILMHERNAIATREAFQRMRQAADMAEDDEQKQLALIELVWIGAAFKQDLEWVRQRVELLPEDDEKVKLARGWLALHDGNPETAGTLFEELGPEDMFARLGLASLPQVDDEQRAQAYQEIIWADSRSVGAIVSALRLHQQGKEVYPTGEGVPLRVLVDNLRRQLWTPALTVSPWVRMKMRVSPGRFDYLQPMKAQVTIRNNTRLPLSVGQGGAVQPILMVVTSPSVHTEPLGQLQPTFFNMGRRLTLDPGASIQADIRLDRFDLGQLTAMYPTATVTFQASALLDPRPMPNGAIAPGPLGAKHGVGSLQARGLPATTSNLQLWISELDGTDPAVRAVAIARLLVIARQPGEGIEAGETRRKISELISQRYPTFNSLLKAWTIRFMLPDQDGEPVSRRVVDLAQRSDDPMVRIVYLVTQTDSPSSAVLTDAIRHENPIIRDFAEALKEGLELDEKRRQEQEQGGAQTQPEDPSPPQGLPNPSPSLDDPWVP